MLYRRMPLLIRIGRRRPHTVEETLYLALSFLLLIKRPVKVWRLWLKKSKRLLREADWLSASVILEYPDIRRVMREEKQEKQKKLHEDELKGLEKEQVMMSVKHIISFMKWFTMKMNFGLKRIMFSMIEKCNENRSESNLALWSWVSFYLIKGE